MATPTKDELISCSAAAAEACLAEAEEANSAVENAHEFPGDGVTKEEPADVDMGEVPAAKSWEIAELHRDAMTLGITEVLRNLPADVGLRPRAALVRVLGKVTPIA